jgi:hypothetical protein
MSRKGKTYHFERPNSPDPNLQFAFDALDILQLNTLPPTPTCRFSPEQQQLLRHADGTVGEVLVLDSSSETCQCDAANDGLVRFASAMTPLVVVVETAVDVSIASLVRIRGDGEYIYPAVSISIRCCSVVPGSSLFLRPEKMPSCFSSAFPAALFTSIISVCSMSRLGGIA